MRLSRFLRSPDAPADPDAVPLRRALTWIAFGLVLVTGIVLYFKYERLVVPLLT